jgi:hypothetical protein
MPSSISSRARSRAARHGRRYVSGVVIAVVAVGTTAGLLVVLIGSMTTLNPFATHTDDHPHSVVLAQLKDMSRYEAATGRFQTLVDQDKTSSILPEWASGEHVVLSAEGDIEASVDMSHLNDGAVQLSSDGKTATVHLPAPQLSQPRLDPSATRVIDRDKGIIDRLGEAAVGSTDQDSALYQQASDKLETAATQSNLTDMAKTNTEKFVTDLLHNSGVDNVTVVFDAPPGQSA